MTYNSDSPEKAKNLQHRAMFHPEERNSVLKTIDVHDELVLKKVIDDMRRKCVHNFEKGLNGFVYRFEPNSTPYHIWMMYIMFLDHCA